jgi:fructokinase
LDTEGELLRGEAIRCGLGTSGIQFDPCVPTGTVDVHVDATGQAAYRIVEPVAWDHINIESAMSVASSEAAKFVCYGTLAQRNVVSRDAVRRTVDAAAAQGTACVLDLNLRDGSERADIIGWSLERADIVKVNEDELEVLADRYLPAGAVSKARHPHGVDVVATQLRSRLDLDALIVTRGPLGAMASLGDDSLVSVPAQAVDAVGDTVGAGDAFLAVVLLGLSNGWDWYLAMTRAARFASTVCTFAGAIPSNSKLHHALRANWQGLDTHQAA